MIDFMVVSLPRCATTWMANWLTTDKTLCLHDPLFKYHYSELDLIQSKKRLGVSCTGLFMFPEFVKKHSSRKVIVHRSLSDINESLAKLQLPLMTQKQQDSLYSIEGMHILWTDVFTKPKEIYEFLLQEPFDEERHKLLKEISMQPAFDSLDTNPVTIKSLLLELKDKGV